MENTEKGSTPYKFNMNSPPFETSRSLIRSPILWGLMILSLALTLPLAYFLNIRFDEAFTLNTTSQGIVYSFKQAITFEQQAPLYFVTLSIWRNIDSSIFFARLFSVLCIPIFVWISAEVARYYVPKVNPLYIAAVAVLHQQIIWSALDIRLYSMMLVLSGLLMLFFYDGYLAEKPNSRSRIFYVAVSILALYTQYYMGFQLVAAAMALLTLKRWDSVKKYVLDMLIVGLFFVPMLFVIKSQISEISGHMEVALSLPDLLRGFYQRLVPLFISVEWIAIDDLKAWFVRLVVIAIAILFIKKLVRARTTEDVALLTITIVLGAFFLLTYFFVGGQSLQTRHMSILILPLIVIPFSALASLDNKLFTRGWLGLIIFLNIGSFFYAYEPLAKSGDFDRVAQYVVENEKPNQPVLIFHPDAKLALSYYYQGQNPLVSIPQENGLQVWDPRNSVIKDEAQIMTLINDQPNSPDRFWLVNDGWCAHGSLSFNCEILDTVVNKYFDVESSKDFFESTNVRLLRRK